MRIFFIRGHRQISHLVFKVYCEWFTFIGESEWMLVKDTDSDYKAIIEDMGAGEVRELLSRELGNGRPVLDEPTAHWHNNENFSNTKYNDLQYFT